MRDYGCVGLDFVVWVGGYGRLVVGYFRLVDGYGRLVGGYERLVGGYGRWGWDLFSLGMLFFLALLGFDGVVLTQHAVGSVPF